MFHCTPLAFCLIVTSIVTGSAAVGASAQPAPNPVLAPWPVPDANLNAFGGQPPFDKIKVSDFKPALEAAMLQARTDYLKISDLPSPANFSNTIEAMERAGDAFDRAVKLFETWGSVMSTPEYKEVEKELSPRLAAFQDEIVQNQKLFKRIESIYRSPKTKTLTSEQRRLVWFRYKEFELRGARLKKKQKLRVAEINQKLASLQTQFSQNELGDEEDLSIDVGDSGELKGLPADLIQMLAAEGQRRGKNGHWIIANTRSSASPLLTYSPNRDLRERVFRMWTSRGDNDNAHNNNKLVPEILKLRAERSRILGFKTFAHWHLANTMAKDPRVAMELMMKVWKPAVARAKREIKEMQAIVNAEASEGQDKFSIEAWDYRYYAEKVRRQKYDFDFDQVKPYLEINKIRLAMFAAAQKLWGLKFEKTDTPAVYHPDVTVYKVTDRLERPVGLWYFDPFARAGKNSGAWMQSVRDQQRFGYDKDGSNDIKTIVSNNSNFIAAAPAQPTLLSWDDAETMFHEFGHAIHGLLSDVTYPTLSGTNTTRDFVEFPSQFNENYLETDEVLSQLTNARGEKLKPDILKKMKAAKTFNEGFKSTEFLASGLVDMKLHLATKAETEAGIDPREFEKRTLKELGMPKEIVMRHRIPAFGHIFSSEGYAAGYYGYLWAEVLDHDAFAAFTETGDPYNQKIAKRLKDELFSRGNTVDPADGYKRFRGRAPKVEALLKARGLVD